jgi:hypothetical protein
MLIKGYRTDNGSAFKTFVQTSIYAAIHMNTFREVKEIEIYTVIIAHKYLPGSESNQNMYRDHWNISKQSPAANHSACPYLFVPFQSFCMSLNIRPSQCLHDVGMISG